MILYTLGYAFPFSLLCRDIILYAEIEYTCTALIIIMCVHHIYYMQFIGVYSVIRMETDTTTPQLATDDTKQYYNVVVPRLSASSSDKSLQTVEDEEVSNVHQLGIAYTHTCIQDVVLPLYIDKRINGHLILLQLVQVQPFWRSFGSAAGVGEETLDLVSETLLN